MRMVTSFLSVPDLQSAGTPDDGASAADEISLHLRHGRVGKEVFDEAAGGLLASQTRCSRTPLTLEQTQALRGASGAAPAPGRATTCPVPTGRGRSTGCPAAGAAARR